MDPYKERDLSVGYICSEALASVVSVVGNSLVAYAWASTQNLRTKRNYYVFALSLADLGVGLVGIPFAVLTGLGHPANNLPACLAALAALIVVFNTATFCLV